jgi:putative spermidine/putrescine transport system substrate-binding protein
VWPLLEACGPGGQSASPSPLQGIKTFTYANYGGTTSEAMVNSWGKKFKELTGISMTTASFSYGKFITQIKENKVDWDGADLERYFAFQYADLLEPIDYGVVGLKESDMIGPGLLGPNYVANYVSAYVIGYRSDKKTAHPKTWAEFFDTKNIPGKRCIYNYPYGMLEIALLADGVPFNQLYPLNLDRAFKKIDTIRKDLIFWNTGAQAQQYIVSGAVDFIACWDARMNYLARSGLPVAVEWAQNVGIVDVHCVPKNDPRKAASMEFIKAACDPQAQAQFSLLVGGYGPPTKAGYAALPDSIKPYITTNPDHIAQQIGIIDDHYWATNIDPVSTRWYAYVGG